MAVAVLEGILQYFNPHSREGSDVAVNVSVFGAPVISIHTPVKGVTSSCSWLMVWVWHFNPHSREGSDNSNPRQ